MTAVDTAQCSRCGVALSLSNARQHRGRWVGRCRDCEREANRLSKQGEVDRRVAAELGPLREAWDFIVWCSQEDYRGPMPEHVRRARSLLTKRRTEGVRDEPRDGSKSVYSGRQFHSEATS